MSASKKVSVGIRLPADEVIALDNMARRLSQFVTGKRKVTRTAVIRLAIKDYLERQ